MNWFWRKKVTGEALTPPNLSVAEDALEEAREQFEEASSSNEMAEITMRLQDYRKHNHFAANLEDILAAAIRKRRAHE